MRRFYPFRVAAARALPLPLAQLPNALTVARLLLIPVFVVLLITAEGGHSWPAGIVFGVAGITDQIDGWLARRWHVESEFGRIADPLADRLMIDLGVILLFVADRLPWPAIAIVAARDLALLAGLTVFAGRGVSVDVNLLGKLATWILYAAVAFVLVTHESDEWPLWLFWTGVGLALAAGGQYLFDTWRRLRA
jgi:CDP-diacylglycerol--glycerol-3-phosphate 3-phosphatidyltransferase